MGWRNKNLLKWFRSLDQDSHHAYIWKHEKFIFSGTKRQMTLKVCMQHLVLKCYQVCSNDDPGLTLTLTYFTARSNLVPYAFVWEKFKTVDFAETIVVYDVKVVRCSNLNEYLKLYEYQRSRSLIDLGPNLSDIFKLVFLSRPIEAKFHVDLRGMGERKLIQMV